MPGRWAGWAGPPGATVRGRGGSPGDPTKLKFGIGSVAVPIGGIFHKFTVYFCCTYVHLTVGESTDIDSVSLLQVFGYIIVLLQCQTASGLPGEFGIQCYCI